MAEWRDRSPCHGQAAIERRATPTRVSHSDIPVNSSGLPRVAVVIAAGGSGSRLGAAVPKQVLSVGGRSLLTRSIEAFLHEPRVREIVVVVPAALRADVMDHLPEGGAISITVTEGGLRRQDSVAAGFRAVSALADVVLVHDAARPFVTGAVIARTIDAAERHGAAIAAVAARDTIKRARVDADGPVIAETLPREALYLAQTPQGFRRDVLQAAIELGEAGVEATDEARLAEMAGFNVRLIEGDTRNIKVTTVDDMMIARALAESAGREGLERTMRVGFGYDSHRLVAERPLILGGVTVPFDKGLAGHSDADVIAHAVTDALLGAGALGDIGQLFPDTDPTWKDADSMRLLARAAEVVRGAGFDIVNIDVTLIAERPKLAPFRGPIRRSLAACLGLTEPAVSVKAKTNEGMDAAGRGEAMVAHAVATLRTAR